MALADGVEHAGARHGEEGAVALQVFFVYVLLHYGQGFERLLGAVNELRLEILQRLFRRLIHLAGVGVADDGLALLHKAGQLYVEVLHLNEHPCAGVAERCLVLGKHQA